VIPGWCGPNVQQGGARPFIRVAALCPILVGATPARSEGAWVLPSQSTVDGRTDYAEVICARWAISSDHLTAAGVSKERPWIGGFLQFRRALGSLAS
jgi:hypothetical protein